MKNCGYCGHPNEDLALVCAGCGKSLEGARTEEPDAELVDPALSPVIVARFNSLQEANLLVDRLEAADIEAFIPEEYSEQVFSGVIGLERLTVRVAAKDYEAAKGVMSAEVVPVPPSPEGGSVCRGCGAEMPETAQACPNCGRPQSSSG